MGTGVLPRERSGRGIDADHSPLCCVEIKNGWSHTSVSRLCPRGVERGNLIAVYHPNMIQNYPEDGGNIISILLDVTSCRVM